MKEYIMETSDTGFVTKVKQELVRCKDCKYWNSNLGEYCEKINSYPGAEWFCANGEAKE